MLKSNNNNNAKSFDTLTISFSILHNYFYRPTKLFSDIYLAKLLDAQENHFFRVQVE